VWLDNVTILSAQPLATEAPAQVPAEQPVVGLQDNLESLTEAACSWWTDLVQSPDGIVGVPYGSIGAPTTNLFGVAAGGNGGNHHDLWNAGFGESGLNDERSLINTEAVLGQPTRSFGIDRVGLGTNQKWIFDGNPSLPSDPHAIDTSGYPNLNLCQHSVFSSLTSSIVDGSITDKSNVIKNGAFIDYCAIKVSDLNVGFESPAPGGERTISNFQVNNVQGLTFVSLPELSAFTGEIDGLKIIDPFLHFCEQGTGGQRNKNQDEQQLLQHSPSFGTPTLSAGSECGQQFRSSQPSALSFDQLALLNQATINIADLADGYLALTLGTTITLDTDAAGYGWFVDPTPFTNEEFVNEGSMVNGQSGRILHGWRFTIHDSRLQARRLGNSLPSPTAPPPARSIS